MPRIDKLKKIVSNNMGFIFIMSHMRSRSSLLSHILGSNPAISGYYESRQSYLNWEDFARLRIHAYFDNTGKSNPKFALDSILWNSYRISNQMCLEKKLKIIFLLREPEDTLKSIIYMGNKIGDQNFKDPDWALKYYCDRVKTIKDYYASRIPYQNGLFIDSDKIIQHTDYLLKRLSNWLELEVELSSNYLIFKHTGKKGYGDPLDNIKKGRIIKNKTDYQGINISPSILHKAKAVHDSCKKMLLKTYESIS